MKKFLIVMIFAIATFVMIGGSSVVIAQERNAITMAEQKDSGGWIKWCDEIIECIVGFICMLNECRVADEEYTNQPMPTCMNTNNIPGCRQTCGVCGATSSGKGPVESMMHACKK